VQIVMPYCRPLRVTKQIEHHRLLQPGRPPIAISAEQLRRVADDNATKCCGRTIDVRRYIGTIFDVVFRFRWITITFCLIITLLGCIGTARLESPPTSEPPLFEKDHNVQV
jgi:hypothetical protein